MIEFKPGDILVVDSPKKGWAGVGGFLVKLRSMIQGREFRYDHVVIFSHYDSEGIPRGLEGRPSAFGWVNLTKYLEGRYITNAGKTHFKDIERAAIVRRATEIVGMPYDWRAIIKMGLDTLGFEFGLAEWPEGGLPSDGTCASLADMLYEWQEWPNPGDWRKTRGTDVADWAEFINRQWT